jgi:hypothetical protein
MADAVPINHGDRMFEVESIRLGEDAIQKREHLVVRVRSAPEENDAWACRVTHQDQPRIVKVSRDDDSTVPTSCLDDLEIRCLSEPDRRRVNRVMASSP